MEICKKNLEIGILFGYQTHFFFLHYRIWWKFSRKPRSSRRFGIPTLGSTLGGHRSEKHSKLLTHNLSNGLSAVWRTRSCEQFTRLREKWCQRAALLVWTRHLRYVCISMISAASFKNREQIKYNYFFRAEKVPESSMTNGWQRLCDQFPKIDFSCSTFVRVGNLSASSCNCLFLKTSSQGEEMHKY